MRILFLVFVIIPLVEIYFLIQVGDRIGALATIFSVIATAVLGAALVRHEGLRTIQALQERLHRQELPGRELLDGAMLLLAGALLVTPGFFTDGIGFLLALPWSRALFRAHLMAVLKERVVTRATMDGFPGDGNGGPGRRSGDAIIEGRFQHHPEEKPPE